MHIDHFTDSQREVLELVRAGQPVPRKRRQSVDVLLRDRYIARNDSNAQLSLAPLGQDIFDEAACRQNKAANFHAGQHIEYSAFLGNGPRTTHEWKPYTIVRIGTARLIVCPGDDTSGNAGRLDVMEPRYCRPRSQS